MPDGIDALLGAILGPRLGFTAAFPAEATRYVHRRAAESGVEPLVWLRTIESRPTDLRDLIAAATVPYTTFFRHPEQIRRFREVLPELSKRSRPVRIWSAGCATGEEPWTLALVAAECGVPVDVLATDVSARAIAKAEKGEYEARETRSLPGFDGKRPFQVPNELRRSVRFEVASLLSRVDGDSGPFDLIFCRNVLIYFDPESIDRAWETFDRRLEAWGAVVVAPVEALLRVPTSFRSGGPLGFISRATASEVAADSPRVPDIAVAPAAEPAPPTPRDPIIASFEKVARLLRADQTDRAEQVLHSILALRDDALGWFLLGETCARRGELTQAKIAYERAAKATVAPAEADLDTVRGAALRRSRQLGE
jgi:chemotaxis protein methyltransferase CheR